MLKDSLEDEQEKRKDLQRIIKAVKSVSTSCKKNRSYLSQLESLIYGQIYQV